MLKKLDARMGSMEARMESMEARMGSMETRMESMDDKLDMLLSVSPKAVIDSLGLQLVQGDVEQLSQITDGTSYTCTYIQDLNGDIWVIGSAHRTFYYSGNFVIIPEEICPYVESIYI